MSKTPKENRVLVLMAGGYPLDETLSAKGLLKHQLQDGSGKPLFEALIDNIPTDIVWVSHNRIFQGFWNSWWSKKQEDKAKGLTSKNFSLFLDTQNSLGKVRNPSLWITSGAASLALNFEISEVIVAPIDVKFTDFKWVADFMKQKNAIVVTKATSDTPLSHRVDLDMFGNIRGLLTPEGEWEFVNLFKVSTEDLLVNGQLFRGDFSDVVARFIKRGVQFKAIKTSAQDMSGRLNNPANETKE